MKANNIKDLMIDYIINNRGKSNIIQCKPENSHHLHQLSLMNTEKIFGFSLRMINECKAQIIWENLIEKHKDDLNHYYYQLKENANKLSSKKINSVVKIIDPDKYLDNLYEKAVSNEEMILPIICHFNELLNDLN